MIPINYVVGDATEPQGSGRKIIAHVCNDVGAWGAGFVLALSAKSAQPETLYRQWRGWNNNLPRELSALPFALGQIQFSAFDAPDTFVCNMLAQRGVLAVRGAMNVQLIDYIALALCLGKLRRVSFNSDDAYIHMPRIGCGLAGGTWDKVEPIILRELSEWNVPVTVYDLPDPHFLDQDALDRAENEGMIPCGCSLCL